jgi:hypothetical protein
MYTRIGYDTSSDQVQRPAVSRRPEAINRTDRKGTSDRDFHLIPVASRELSGQWALGWNLCHPAAWNPRRNDTKRRNDLLEKRVFCLG